MRQEIAQALIHDPFFMECLNAAANNQEFIQNLDRLTGTHIHGHLTASPIEKMVDQATGRVHDDIGKFVESVYDLVYTRVPRPKLEEG